MHSSGLEMLLDLRGCQASALNDPDTLDKILRDAARAARFEIVSQIAHQFSHQGVTLVLILSQSHLALHTWPEERFATIDAYACGETASVERALQAARECLIAQFKPQSFSHRIVARGAMFDTNRKPI